MEMTKQYLEARIKQIRTQLADEEEMYYALGALGQTTLETLLQELLTLKELFDEEHERISQKVATLSDNIKLLYDRVMPIKTQ